MIGSWRVIKNNLDPSSQDLSFSSCPHSCSLVTMTKRVAANAALLKAVKLRDVKRAVKNRADVTCRDPVGWMPITWASWRGDVELVDVLVSRKTSEENHFNGSSSLAAYLGDALHISATCGQMEVTSALLDYGADKDVKNEDGLTPFMQAAKRGHVATVQHLLEWGADVQA